LALEAASAQRAKMVPIFLATIEAFLAEPAEQPTAPFYIFHLMGSWREKSAYQPSSISALLAG
jgi:hypothetical protein